MVKHLVVSWFLVLIPQLTMSQTQLLEPGELAGFGPISSPFASSSIVQVEGMPFSEAIRVEVEQTPPNPWEVQLLSLTVGTIDQGDGLIASVWVRRVDSTTQRGLFDLVVEDSSDPFIRTLSSEVTPNEQWRLISIPFPAYKAAAPGAIKLDFQIGYQQQTLEFGGFSLTNYGAITALSSESVDEFTLADGGFATGSIIPVDNDLFDRAWQVEVQSQPENPWDVQLSTTLGSEVQAGDTLALAFWYRDPSLLGGQDQGATLRPVFEFDGPPYAKSFDGSVEAAREWRQAIFPFTVQGTPPSGAWGLRFQLGTKVQQLQIGGVQLLTFGSVVDARALSTSFPFPDKSPLASWRVAADQRIRQHRMAPLEIKVTNELGQPLSGALVRVELTQHAFGFGSAVVGDRLNLPGSENDVYRERFLEHFNMAVSENFLKWIPWEGNPKENAVAAVDWLRSNQVRVRGHNLVWPSWSFMPADAEGLFGDDLRDRVTDHIEEEASYPGLVESIEEWDVVNESFTNRDVQDRLGDDSVLQDWMSAARAAAPFSRLYLNDFDLLPDGANNQAKTDYYLDLISDYKSRGVPVDGMGFQSHFRYGLTSMDRLLATLDRFAALGVRLSITEFDHNIEDAILQADYLEDFLTLCFSHPALDSFLVWGFWDGAHWLGNAPLYNLDWTLKPSGEAWAGLVSGTWKTLTEGLTQAGGNYDVDGFLGEYEVTATHKGRSKTVQAVLEASGTTVEIRLSLPIGTQVQP